MFCRHSVHISKRRWWRITNLFVLYWISDRRTSFKNHIICESFIRNIFTALIDLGEEFTVCASYGHLSGFINDLIRFYHLYISLFEFNLYFTSNLFIIRGFLWASTSNYFRKCFSRTINWSTQMIINDIISTLIILE